MINRHIDLLELFYNQNIKQISLNNHKILESTSHKIDIYDCNHCHSIDSIKNLDGNWTCVSCGEIKGADISQGLECQYSGIGIGDNSTPSRSGLTNNNLLYKSNFSTIIVGNKSSNTIRKVNNVWELLERKERTLYNTFKKMTDNSRRSDIPNNVINYSHVLYKLAYDKQKKRRLKNKGSRSDNLEGLQSGCTYYSCKLHGINRSHHEIAKVYNTDRKVVSTGCKLLFKLLNKDVNLNHNTTNYRDFLERYACRLEINDEELEIVKEICQNIYNLGLLSDSKPYTITSVCIYFTSVLYNFNIDKKQIVDKCETTEATLDKHFKILLHYVEDLIV